MQGSTPPRGRALTRSPSPSLREKLKNPWSNNRRRSNPVSFRARATTRASLTLALICLCVFTANEWRCAEYGCLSRTGFYGGEGSSMDASDAGTRKFVGGGSVIGPGSEDRKARKGGAKGLGKEEVMGAKPFVLKGNGIDRPYELDRESEEDFADRYYEEGYGNDDGELQGGDSRGGRKGKGAWWWKPTPKKKESEEEQKVEEAQINPEEETETPHEEAAEGEDDDENKDESEEVLGQSTTDALRLGISIDKGSNFGGTKIMELADKLDAEREKEEQMKMSGEFVDEDGDLAPEVYRAQEQNPQVSTEGDVSLVGAQDVVPDEEPEVYVPPGYELDEEGMRVKIENGKPQYTSRPRKPAIAAAAASEVQPWEATAPALRDGEEGEKAIVRLTPTPTPAPEPIKGERKKVGALGEKTASGAVGEAEDEEGNGAVTDMEALTGEKKTVQSGKGKKKTSAMSEDDEADDAKAGDVIANKKVKGKGTSRKGGKGKQKTTDQDFDDMKYGAMDMSMGMVGSVGKRQA